MADHVAATSVVCRSQGCQDAIHTLRDRAVSLFQKVVILSWRFTASWDLLERNKTTHLISLHFVEGRSVYKVGLVEINAAGADILLVTQDLANFIPRRQLLMLICEVTILGIVEILNDCRTLGRCSHHVSVRREDRSVAHFAMLL